MAERGCRAAGTQAGSQLEMLTDPQPAESDRKGPKDREAVKNQRVQSVWLGTLESQQGYQSRAGAIVSGSLCCPAWELKPNPSNQIPP